MLYLFLVISTLITITTSTLHTGLVLSEQGLEPPLGVLTGDKIRGVLLAPYILTGMKHTLGTDLRGTSAGSLSDG